MPALQMPKKHFDSAELGPSRRRVRGRRMNAPVFCYVSEDERELIEWAAGVKNRSVSSFVADVVLEEAHALARMHDVVASTAVKPSAKEAVERIRKAGKAK